MPERPGISGLRRHPNIEVTRAVAVLAIFAYHFLGFWGAATGHVNLTAGFVGHVQRTLRIYGGLWGVSVFVVIAGLGLVAAMGRRPGIAAFYRRRLLRIYPMFWWTAIPLMVVLVIAGRLAPERFWQVPFWLTGTTILWPGHLWPITAPWWFITLIVQIYLVFPLLWRVAERWGLAAVVGAALVVNVASVEVIAHAGLSHAAQLFLGLAFVGCRLVEVTAGLCLGALYWRWAGGERPAASSIVTVALVVPAAFAALQLTGRPMQVPALAVAFVVVMLPGVVRRVCGSRALSPLLWLGVISYAFFLTHSLVIPPTIDLAGRAGIHSEASVAIVCLGAAVAVAAGFHYSYAFAARRLLRQRSEPAPARAE